MFTRIKQFMLVAALGAILSVVFSGTAVATSRATFTVTKPSDSCVAPCAITVTDTTPEASDHTWDFHYDTAYFTFEAEVAAGNSHCLDAKCSQATWTYETPGSYYVSERVSNTSGNMYEYVKVVAPEDAPAPITLAGPATVSLPTVLELLSPKTHLKLWSPGCVQTGLVGSEAETCWPYLVKRVGPDSSGLYHYRVRLPVAQPGTVELTFLAWNKDRAYGDVQTIPITVTGNAYRFGDVRSCYWPVLLDSEGHEKRTSGGREITNLFDLYYYAVMNSSVTVKLQVRQGTRWQTKRQKHISFSLSGSPSRPIPVPPWTRRHVRVAFGPPGPGRRFTYEIKHGKRLLKQGTLSRNQCTV